MEFTYIYKSKTYTDTSLEFMKDIGMDDEQIESVLRQKDYELGEGVFAKRREAYIKESDPLFIEATFDNDPAKMQAWRDKVIEIKARYKVSDIVEK